MLTPKDIELIKRTREEITSYRLKQFTVIRSVEGAEDPYTGNPIEGEEELEVLGTWHPVTGSGTSGTDYEYVGGVRVISGDITANIDIGYDIIGATHVVRDGERYAVRAVERLGLGEDNRYFILLRKVY